MLHPSYTDLMKVVNKDVEEGDSKVVNSRYSIVMATSKRARQLIAGELPLVPAKDGQKPLSIAIEELNEGETLTKSRIGTVTEQMQKMQSALLTLLLNVLCIHGMYEMMH